MQAKVEEGGKMLWVEAMVTIFFFFFNDEALGQAISKL